MTSMVTMMIMGRLEIDQHSDVPSYRQLAALLREQITSGRIGPRELLPSITYLTGETGLSVGTVRHAIAVLVDEGYAYIVPGRGTFASPRLAPFELWRCVVQSTVVALGLDAAATDGEPSLELGWPAAVELSPPRLPHPASSSYEMARAI